MSVRTNVLCDGMEKCTYRYICFNFLALRNYKIIVFDMWGIDTVIVIKIPLVPFPEVMCIKFLSNNK